MATVVAVDTKHPVRRMMRDEGGIKVVLAGRVLSILWPRRGSVRIRRPQRQIDSTFGVIENIPRKIPSRSRGSTGFSSVLNLRRGLAENGVEVVLLIYEGSSRLLRHRRHRQTLIDGGGFDTQLQFCLGSTVQLLVDGDIGAVELNIAASAIGKPLEDDVGV